MGNLGCQFAFAELQVFSCDDCLFHGFHCLFYGGAGFLRYCHILSLLFGIASAVQAAKDGEIELGYISKIFEPVYV